MQSHDGRILLRLLICALLPCLGAGCATTAMKGTPFYSGEYEKRKGPVEDRVNLWPLLYYRDPALSILWPIVEHTDNYLAVRPIFSAYGLDQPKREYNVLWPVGQFDRRSGNNRIFPFFWGKDYRVGFPLYWHGGEPLGEKGGLDTLLPLWWYSSNRKGSNLHVAWPVFNRRAVPGREGGRLWPVYGRYREGGSRYAFALWPLWNQHWQEESSSSSQLLLPLFYRERDAGSSTFYSLPYSQEYTSNGDNWHLLLPLALWGKEGRERFVYSLLAGCAGDGEKDFWYMLPLLSFGGHDRDSSWWWAPWPLAHGERKGEGGSSYVFPLYYRAAGPDRSTFLSLPYSAGHDGASSWWWALGPLAHGERDGDRRASHVFPLYYRSVDRDRSLFVSLPYWAGHNGAASWWWALGPLAHGRREGDRSVSHVVPLYYRSADRNGSLFLSLPYSAGRAGSSSWGMVPPLWFGRSGPDSSLSFTPLFSWGSEREDSRRWSCLFPLYYRSHSDAGSSFVTPLAGLHTDGDGHRWTVYPLLSTMRREGGRGDLWIGGPLFHARWDPEGASHHLLPLYYRNHHSGTFISPLAVRWHTEDVSTVAIPPVLSWERSSPKRSDLWMLLGLAHASWGEEGGSSHLLPLFYRDSRDGLFVSPLYASLRHEPGKTIVMPPLLSAYSRDHWDLSKTKRSDLWMLLGLAHASWGEEAGSSYFVPLFYRNAGGGLFVSPLYASVRRDPGKAIVIPPLLSAYSRDDWEPSKTKRSDLWMLLGLGHASWGERAGSSHVFPIFYRNPREGLFLSLLYASLDQEPCKTVVIPPLLSAYVREDQDRDLWMLLGLAHQRWSRIPDRAEGYLFPVYRYDNDGFQTPLFGWYRGETRGWWYPLTPLLGVRTGQVRGSWLFPLYGYSREVQTGVKRGHVLWGPYRSEPNSARSGLFPIYSYRRWGGGNEGSRSELDVLLIGRWASTERKAPGRGVTSNVVVRSTTNRLFPLWSCRGETANGEPTERRRSALLFLWDYRHEYPLTANGQARNDYVRSRLLYRLWHYERLDDAVSVDMIPAITYDRKGGERRKVSFLWRAFRYERKGTERAVDLLYIPMWRTRWAGGDGAKDAGQAFHASSVEIPVQSSGI